MKYKIKKKSIADEGKNKLVMNTLAVQTKLFMNLVITGNLKYWYKKSTQKYADVNLTVLLLKIK